MRKTVPVQEIVTYANLFNLYTEKDRSPAGQAVRRALNGMTTHLLLKADNYHGFRNLREDDDTVIKFYGPKS